MLNGWILPQKSSVPARQCNLYCMFFFANKLSSNEASLLQKLIRLAASDEGNGEAGAGERKVSLLLRPYATFIRKVLAFGGRTRMPNRIPLF